ncbi:MAG TPA: methionine--tRNA ligase [Thermomicrobiaceae bacterium]|nr:methionine--tRNA ligase [Thermomicrobiaceae bacterium]
MSGSPYYVTTPIYYANADPHIGTLYTTVVADFLARFHRLLGHDVRLTTGSDEHGEKIFQAALARGEPAQVFVDRVAASFQSAWGAFLVGDHTFVRTTDSMHAAVVRDALERVRAAGDVYFAEYEGRYCVGCERFLAERELVDGRCPDHDRAPEPRREGNWFFRMGRYQDDIRRAIQVNPALITPERYRNETLAMLAEPVGDLSISRPRTRVPWGIPVPWDPSQVTYVWFDALLAYLTALDGDERHRSWPAAHHLIGKDILKPHAIFWPAMLLAMGLPVYRRLLVGGYLLGADGRKMSKSLGNVVDPFTLAAAFGPDAVRYYLLREFPYGQDGSVSAAALQARYTADLANTLGNLVNRVRTMILRYRDGVVPEGHASPADRELVDGGASLLARVTPLVDDLYFHRALEQAMAFVQSLNRYVDETQPWQLAKSMGAAERLDAVLANLVEGLRIASGVLAPAMPGKAAEVRGSLGLDPPGHDALDHWTSTCAGRRVPREAPLLFPPVAWPLEDAPPRP